MKKIMESNPARFLIFAAKSEPLLLVLNKSWLRHYFKFKKLRMPIFVDKISQIRIAFQGNRNEIPENKKRLFKSS